MSRIRKICVKNRKNKDDTHRIKNKKKMDKICDLIDDRFWYTSHTYPFFKL